MTHLRMHNTASASQTSSSIDKKEAAKFAALASQWWDPAGPFAPLLRMNPARCKFIRDAVCAVRGLEFSEPEPFRGLRLLDVGCGGGILSESMARMGAQVHGIDITQENVQAATSHAQLDPVTASRVRYQCIPLEDLSHHLNSPTSSQPDSAASSGSSRLYDVVLASEVLEHVKRPDDFIKTLTSVLAPGGTLVLSTINRTPASYAVAIVAAEYLTGIVPRGTHSWKKFITPEEAAIMARQAGLQMVHAAGIELRASSGTFVLTQDLGVNYIAAFHRV